jgi:PhnB protein
MTDTPPALPPVKGRAICYLNIDGAIKAAEFYQKAFGAEVAMIMPPDDKGRTMHAHLYVNGGSVMISDFYPEHGHAVMAPQGFSIALQMESGLDEFFQAAVDAGCKATQPPSDMFWGDRYASVTDPFGVHWAMNQPKG